MSDVTDKDYDTGKVSFAFRDKQTQL